MSREWRGIVGNVADGKMAEEFTSSLSKPALHEVSTGLQEGNKSGTPIFEASCYASGLDDVNLYVESDSVGNSRIEALLKLLVNIRCRAELFDRLEQAIQNTIDHERRIESMAVHRNPMAD